ncbi:hypothetical protein H4R99_001106 [Coemansia sp. RSA 1722]|nr:hypothetical protein H4R99_001106 [Coemansia sp. RSA 1722]
MNPNERAETFREMSALGNLKVVVAYLRNGIDVNCKNHMNGWTALHWACSRGHGRVVETLIRAGADVYVENAKGQRPIEVCKDNYTRELFRIHMKDEEVDAVMQTSDHHEGPRFVPNYIANPNLSMAWESPPDTVVADGEDIYLRGLQKEPIKSNSLVRVISPPADRSVGREFLVYRDTCDEAHLLGSVFVEDVTTQKVGELVSQIRQELDDVPMSFGISRHNGQQAVPVSKKQEEFSLERVFRGASDAVVIKQKDSSSIHRVLN